MFSLFVKKAAGVLLMLGPLALISACGPTNVAWRPPTDVDVIEKAPVGLNYEVTEFSWAYVEGGRQLQVTGSVKNNGQSVSRAVIYGFMFDERGDGIAMGESWTEPRFLQPGQTGRFSIVAQTSRPASTDRIKNIRLLTNAQPE